MLAIVTLKPHGVYRPGWYKAPADYAGVSLGEGDGIREEDRMMTIEDMLEKAIKQADEMIESEERNLNGLANSSKDDSTTQPSTSAPETLTDILLGFPEKVTGEIVFCNADNINTDAISPGKYTYQDNSPARKWRRCVWRTMIPRSAPSLNQAISSFQGFSFGCGSSREQAVTVILAKGIPLVIAGSFGNIFSRNSINNALMGVEVPKLVRRLREVFSSSVPSSSQQQINEPAQNRESLDSPPLGPVTASPQAKQLTHRTGWTLEWDVRRSTVTVQEGPEGEKWSVRVGELPPNVQEIIALGGLESWVRKEIGGTM